jgi:diacylglycerol kinase family enzyme
MSKLRVLRLFAKVYDGTVLEVREVCYRQAQSVSIAPVKPMPLELDGELPGFTPLNLRVLPGILPLLQL